eukprot:TRINITY_DN4431_c0_g1_i1.p1 TRINITY_DN4431_c0_g1~~TRINITY_DN4431_c0_g1_i1.p1  ORF type:complete len:482 (-),score=90.53 TRINITY_DN4431_c0_g1_i1:186-1631(-)
MSGCRSLSTFRMNHSWMLFCSACVFLVQAASRESQVKLEARLDFKGGNSLVRKHVPREKIASGTSLLDLHAETTSGITQQLKASNITFFIYDLPAHLNRELIFCYKQLHGKELWEDFREERGQNSADIWIHQLLTRHHSRTYDREKANMFFIPFYGFLSTYFNGKSSDQSMFAFAGNRKCAGKDHLQRVVDLTNFLEQQPAFREHPEKHVMPVSFWNVAKEQPEFTQPGSVVVGPLFNRLQHSVLLVYEPKFASESNLEQYKQWHGRLVPIPYVAKPGLLNMESHTEDILKKHPVFFFQGEMSTPHVTTPGIERRQLIASAFQHVPEAWIVDTHKNYSGQSYETGLLKSRLCLVPEGDTPSSPRLFDAIVAGCVPVILSNNIDLPFNDLLDWDKFSLHPSTSDFLASGSSTRQFLEQSKAANAIKKLADTPPSDLTDLQRRLQMVRELFVYGRGNPLDPAKCLPGQAVDAILLATAKVVGQ